ncbi:hypothetical protein [Treponema sp. R80B11-R83G3]
MPNKILEYSQGRLRMAKTSSVGSPPERLWNKTKKIQRINVPDHLNAIKE